MPSVTRNLSILGNVPQTLITADYTLVSTDAGGCIYHPSIDTLPRAVTIPLSAFPIGTVISFVNDTGAGQLNITPTTGVTLVVAGVGGVTSKGLAANGFASIMKVATNRWMLSGAGLV